MACAWLRSWVAAPGSVERDIGRSILHSSGSIPQAKRWEITSSPSSLEELQRMTPAVLVLDEVDTLTNDRLLLDLRALIQHSSPNLSVVVATRGGPA